MKNHFKCGHVGKGQFCHRCAEAERLTKRIEKETDAGKITALKADIERLLKVPKNVSDAPMMPSDPVPT